MSDNSRQEILNRIAAVRPKRIAAVDIQVLDSVGVYKPIQPDAISCFKSELEAINGQCILCENEKEITLKIKEFLDLKGLTTVFCRDSAIARLLSDAKIPYISVLVDPCTGGVSASLAMLGDLNIAEPKALIGFAGPRVIEQTVREKLPDGFQRSEFLIEKGFIDMIIDRRQHRDKIYNILIKLIKNQVKK